MGLFSREKRRHKHLTNQQLDDFFEQVWIAYTGDNEQKKEEAGYHLSSLYSDPADAFAALREYAERHGLDVAELTGAAPQAERAEASEQTPHRSERQRTSMREESASEPGLTLPENADLRKDWGKIAAASHRHLSAAPGRLDLRNGRWVISPRIEQVWSLSNDIKPTDGERLAAQAQRQGFMLLSFDPFMRTAVVTEHDAMTERVRGYVASFVGARPWELDVTLCYDGERIEHVVVGHVPSMGSADKRLKTARELVLGLPGGSTGWGIRDDAQAQRWVLSYGRPASLPQLVPLLDELPEQVNASEWNRLPIGRNPLGEPVTVDLKLGPHLQLVGPSGSGKSIALVTLISQSLCRGMDVAVVDPVKMGADFTQLRPFCAGWADNIASAQALMESIYAIVEERRLLCRDYGVGFWADLPADVRAEKNIKPLLVVIDEYVSLVIPRTVSKSLPKDHPLVEEANAANSQKAIIAEYAGRIAREARFVGVHLALAAQRPDAVYLSGEMRSNLTSAIQLAKPGSLPSRDAIAMVFTADQVDKAMETLAELDDGRSRGLGVIGAEGGSVTGMRVSFAPTAQVADRLAVIGVPEPKPIPVKNVHAEPEFVPVTLDIFGTQSQATPADFNPFEDAPAFTIEPEPFSLDVDAPSADLSSLVIEPEDDLWS